MLSRTLRDRLVQAVLRSVFEGNSCAGMLKESLSFPVDMIDESD